MASLLCVGYWLWERHIATQQTISFELIKFDRQERIIKGVLHLSHQDSKILANQQTQSKSYSRITVDKSSNIQDIEIRWPEPTEQFLGQNYYLDHADIHINLKLADLSAPTNIDFIFDLYLCNATCIHKAEQWSLNLEQYLSPTSQLKVLIRTLLLAFIGGVILNFMPCVLPVLSLKILSLLKMTHHNYHQIRRYFAAGSLGIILSFMGFAIIAHVLRNGGNYVGLGLNFQQPGFIIFLIISLLLYTNNLAGKIHLRLPNRLQNFLNNHQQDSILIGSFAGGVFATLLATPCTAPFIGTALSFALSYRSSEIYLIFAAIGMGMSLPYLLLIIDPRMIKLLPKTGHWMGKLKTLLIVLLYATIIWLLYILQNLLDQKAAILLFMICLLIQFVLQNQQRFLRNNYLKYLLIAALVSMSFYIPTTASKQDKLHQLHVEQIWQPYNKQRLRDYLDQGYVILLDIGADWCITCKYNKFTVLNSQYMLDFYQQHQIITMHADYTANNPEVTQILADYHQHGIPFDVILSKKYPNGIILPTILKPSDLVINLNKAR